MQRRQLIKYFGIVPAVYPLLKLTDSLLITKFQSVENGSILDQLIFLNDKLIPSILEKQERVKVNKYFGGVHDDYEIYTVHQTVYFINTIVCGYISKSSKYYHSQELIVPLENAIGFILSNQHPDGTIDLHSTNFHSTPDTAFMVEPLTAVYEIINKSENLNDSP